MPVEFKHARLENGLTIIAEVDPSAHSAAVGYFVRTGARDEPTPQMGVSHFLEHMMFKGTDKRSAERLNQDFDRLGARNNAYTSAELTCFHATVTPDRLTDVNDVLADMMRPALRDDDFTTEKGVILEEIAMYDDNPFWVLYEHAMEKFYGKHPIGHRVLGTKESITAMTSVQMREYFEQRYSADNTVVAISGRMDFDAMVDHIAQRCGSWRPTKVTRDPARPATEGGTLELRRDNVSRAYAMLVCEAPGMEDDRRYAAAMLTQILGGSDNSRLHWALIEPGLAEEAEAAHDARDHAGDYLVYVSCEPQRLDEVWSIVEKTIDEFSASLTEDDLAKVRSRAVTAATLAGERPSGRMQRLGRLWTYLGRHIPLEEELEGISGVTLADVRALLGDAPMRPRLIARLLPKADAEADAGEENAATSDD